MITEHNMHVKLRILRVLREKNTELNGFCGWQLQGIKHNCFLD